MIEPGDQSDARDHAVPGGREDQPGAERGDDDPHVLDRAVGERAAEVGLDGRVQDPDQGGQAADDQHDQARPERDRRQQIGIDPQDRVDAEIGGRSREHRREAARRREMIDDRAHPLHLLVEFSALHRRVFLTLVVREETVAHAGPERLRRHEHPALHHQLGQPDAAQEGRFPALVRARDDHEQPGVGVDVVADDLALPGERQARVVQSPAREPPLAEQHRHGKASPLALFRELIVQIGATDVERQLRAQHPEETEDVIDRLRQCVRDEIDTAVA